MLVVGFEFSGLQPEIQTTFISAQIVPSGGILGPLASARTEEKG